MNFGFFNIESNEIFFLFFYDNQRMRYNSLFKFIKINKFRV
jgi:hypothetical protein